MQPKYDLLLKGGEVIDHAQNMRGRYDVALANGKIALVAENIPKEQTKQVENVSGKMVIPGLIDMNGHYYHTFLPWCINPDNFCLPNGVTTAVDSGTGGADNATGLVRIIAPESQTRLYSFLHISLRGLVFWNYRAELYNINLANAERAAKFVENNRKGVVGIYVRMGLEAAGYFNSMPALLKAIEAAEKVKLPVMVNYSNIPDIPLDTLFKQLRPGDILTPVFNLPTSTILNASGKVHPRILDASERGIIYDLGHGIHMNYKLARTAMEQGFLPDTLSTHVVDTSPWSSCRGLREIPNLLEIMSLFWAMGLPLDEVVRRATENPAKAIGLSSELGSLRPGSAGDVSVLDVQEGDFIWTDLYGYEVQAKRKLVPIMTICNGTVRYKAS